MPPPKNLFSTAPMRSLLFGMEKNAKPTPIKTKPITIQ
ncbi:hypothetical protein MTTB_06730 [Methanothermobacter tenebrarum]|uniref:Uncharacterized protein n=1 Tax=Methanothermobacter tenebrarum TaxID=680118 RepID=A0ABM7YDF1_9EURY|nr:hypothetical protein MTTB_06730 [Methanothermobacter tenebrarum]